ncbi:hypothetical protein JCM10550A_03600 [Methanogenium cariaci]
MLKAPFSWIPFGVALARLILTAIIGGSVFTRETHPAVRKFGRPLISVPTMTTGIGRKTFVVILVFFICLTAPDLL